jgi:hypothetical protein
MVEPMFVARAIFVIFKLIHRGQTRACEFQPAWGRLRAFGFYPE